MAHVETIAAPMLDACVAREDTSMVLNRIMATILSPGTQSDRSLYVHTDNGATLEIEGCVQTPALQPLIVPGHRVLIVVSSVGVQISAPRSRNLYLQNEWAGRVVLTEHRGGMDFVTVKILGQPVAFTSTLVAPWMDRSVRTWDTVSLSIAPSAVRLMPLGTGARLRMRLIKAPAGP